MSSEHQSSAWWLEPPAAADEAQVVASGLDSRQAKAHLAEFGPNLLREKSKTSLLRQYLSRFKNPLVLILLVASAVSAFTGEEANFLIISTIVLLSVTLDFVQEHRANAAAEKLRLSVSVRTRVLRDGREGEIAVAEVVPGDVVQPSADATALGVHRVLVPVAEMLWMNDTGFPPRQSLA